MSEPTSPGQADSGSASKPVEINENTLTNAAKPEIIEWLVERINPEFGLLDKLLSSKALTRGQLAEVNDLSSKDKKNLRIIEIVTKKEKIKELFHALKDTHQEHLVNYVTANGEYNQDLHGGAWPLTDRETDILDANQSALVELLDFTSDEIIQKLYEVKVLNPRQKEFICKQAYDYKKAEALLDLLYYSSLSDYWKLIQCLRNTNQLPAARILLEGGAAVRVHNQTDADSAVENEIVARIESILSSINLDGSNRVLERLQLKLFAARVGHSVNLYVLCGTVEELTYLSDILASGELHRSIEIFFNHLISRSEKVNVFTTVSAEDIERCKKFLEVDRSQETVSGKDILKLCEQMKVEEERRTEEEQQLEQEEEERRTEEEKQEEEKESMDDTDGQIVEEVEADKAKALEAGASRFFAEEMHDELYAAQAQAEAEKRGPPAQGSGSRTPFEVMAAILRNNTDYFLEYMRPRGLIDRLHGADCLTDEETRYIKTLREDCDKNDEILKVIRGLGLEKYYVLIKFLRSLNQSVVAEVAEKGGVALKATITSEEGGDLERIEKKLVERINQLLNKTSPRSVQLVQFLSLLGKGNIQILNVRWEHDIIIWFWCRSVQALKAIDDMNESEDEQLTKLMTEFFKILLDTGDRVPEIINIDLEDPDKMLVVRTSSIHRDKEIPVLKISVCAASMLGSSIYILHQKPSGLLVFDESDPSKQTGEIPLAVITDPMDIVASQKSSCLYISDRGNASVWKFTPTDNNVTAWLQNIGSPYTLSATSEGGVIRVDHGKPFHLEIYNADAQRINHIKLPDIVQMPHHAVETSAGTYVVSYGEPNGGNGVCEITRDGNMISIFDTLLTAVDGIDQNVNKILKGFSERLIHHCPRYLAVNEHGEIYATDPDNGELMVFDSRLKLEDVVKNDLLKEPVNVQCVKGMRKLLIVYGGAEQQSVGLFTHKLE